MLGCPARGGVPRASPFSWAASACTSDDGWGGPDDGGKDSHHVAERKSGPPDFAVIGGADSVLGVVDADGTVVAVNGLAHEFGDRFAVLDADRIAFVASGSVGVVKSDGSVTKVACPGCHGLAVTPTGLMTAQDNYQPGFGFDLVGLDDDLQVTSRTPAARIVERPQDSTHYGDVTPAAMLGATEEAAYVGYLSRIGGVRRGPTVIAAYGLDGQVLGSDIVNEQLEHAALSADGRLLALSMGGEGGACVLATRLVVIDTATMTDLGTGPEIPENVGLPGGQTLAAWFTGIQLVWAAAGSQQIVTGVGAVHVPDESGCDATPALYARHYDPAQQQLQDEGPLDAAQVGWFAGDCATDYLSDPTPEPALVVHTAAGVVPLDATWTSVQAAPAPSGECSP